MGVELGIWKPLSDLFISRCIHTTIVEGEISNEILGGPASLNTMCQDFIPSPESKRGEKKAAKKPYATVCADFETVKSAEDDSTLQPYMGTYGEFDEVAQSTSNVIATHGLDICADELVNGIVERYKVPEEELEKLYTDDHRELMIKKPWVKIEYPGFHKFGRNVVVLFHNLKFDNSFFITAAKRCGFIVYKRIVNGGGPVTIVLHNNSKYLKIHLRDSLRICPLPIAKFPKSFKYPGWELEGKDLMLHDALGPELMRDEGKLTNELSCAELFVRVRQVNLQPRYAAKQFSFDAWMKKFRDGGHLYIDGVDGVEKIRFRDYVEHYAKLDVSIMAKGLKAFDQLMDEIYDASDIVHPNYLVTPSNGFSCAGIGDNYAAACGAFDGIQEVRGQLATYLQAFVVGGRCQVQLGRETEGVFEIGEKEGEEKKDGEEEEEDDKIDIPDAVSLYPSAQIEMKEYPAGRFVGILPGDIHNIKNGADMIKFGKSKAITSWFCDFVLDPECTDLPDHRFSMGLVGIKPKDPKDGGSIEWKNDLRGEPVVHFDSVSLEDYCDKLGMKPESFIFLKGVYTRATVEELEKAEGQLGKVISKLFETKLKAKKSGNCGLEMVAKLLLNSSYGRTIMKAPEMKEKLTCGKEYESMMNREGGRVIRAEKITNEEDLEDQTWSVSLKRGSHKSFSRQHCGAIVLSTARNIMNRVIHAAAEADIPIYYTDTDSIHVPAGARKQLEIAYEKLYPNCPKLYGDGLGQFNNDIKMEYVDDKGEDKKGEGVGLSAKYCAKKVYFVRTESVEELNTKDGKKIVTGCKKSHKGIPNDAYDLCVYGEGGGDKEYPFKEFAAGRSVEFDLSAGGKPLFKCGGTKAVPHFDIRKETPVNRVVTIRKSKPIHPDDMKKPVFVFKKKKEE